MRAGDRQEIEPTFVAILSSSLGPVYLAFMHNIPAVSFSLNSDDRNPPLFIAGLSALKRRDVGLFAGRLISEMR